LFHVPEMSVSTFRLCVAALCTCLVAGAFAAPLAPARGPGDQGGLLTDDAAPTETADWAAGAVPGTGRTMELLLEMQKQTPETPRAGTAAAGTAPARPPVTALALPSGALEVGSVAQRPAAGPADKAPTTSAPVLFGATQAPAIRAQSPATTDWQTAGTTPAGQPSRPSRPSTEMQRWMAWPAQFIAWVRENRYGVLAAALLTLVLVAGGSALMNRRRYAA